MNANLPEAEAVGAAGDANVDLTAGVEPIVEQPERRSPASAVCYLDQDRAQEPLAPSPAPPDSRNSDHAPSDGHDVWIADESDNTPRSEVPSALDATAVDPQQSPVAEAEPGYFSPRPRRLYSSKLPSSAPVSTDPSPTASLNPSTTSVNIAEIHSAEHAVNPITAEHRERPSVQRDSSSASTASVSTIRPHSVDPIQNFTPPSRQLRDGPHYPNQSYAALQFQHYPISHQQSQSRTRSSHTNHFSSRSTAHITTMGLPQDAYRDIMDTGSRTVGNSPASSPGLFNPTTPPLRPNQQIDDGCYSSPYLHFTQRQAPKETHVADVDFDPISGRKIINQYEIIDELGRGVHGKVKLGKNLETGATVAIKIVDRYSKRRRLGKNTSHEDKIKKEIAILKKARHPNIVSLLEVIDDPSRKKVYIVLEHMQLGEVKWRTPGEREIVLLEWRRYQRELQGQFDNEHATVEDDRILNLARQKLDHERLRSQRTMQRSRQRTTDNETWSFENGGDSEDDVSENGQDSTSTHSGERTPSHQRFAERWREQSHHETNMETAVRATTPTTAAPSNDPEIASSLEGTMYGAYDTELIRGRTPSVADSSSSRLTDEEDEIPEHFRYVPLLTLQETREIFRDTVLGLEYLHFQNIYHRDIKPANLLRSDHRIKISDFGVSYLRGSSPEEPTGDQSESDFQDADDAIELAKTVGTPAFYAPELCSTDLDAETPKIDQQIDIFALGVTLYCLVYGRVPFYSPNGTFHLMKLIAETEPHLSEFRLRAVAEQSGSRPSSHGKMYQSMNSNKRAPHDLAYEPVDDTLRDLLKRLLKKNPRERIKIKEIKHHPWLLHGLENFDSWVQETDPDRSAQGRRIEISKDDVDQAVVPITLIDRVRSGVRKTLDTVLGMGRRGGSRRRAHSTATNQEHPPSISAHSSSSTVSQEGRRPSLALNQSIFDALTRSRESDHPLSQSVTASPEATERAAFFIGPNSRTASPAHSIESNEFLAPLAAPTRPLPPERAHSTLSSAASIRTIRPSDLARSGRPISPNIPPALPGTPTALDTPGGSNLGGLFGGVPRRFVNSVRSRELLRPRQDHLRAKSIDKLVGTDDDAHSGPSIALSTTLAAGHVDQPDALKELSPTFARGPSPNPFDSKWPHSLERAASRQSSVSSASSYANRANLTHDHLPVSPMPEVTPHVHPPHQRDTSDERYNRAKDDFVRRRVMEEQQGRDRPLSLNLQRPNSALSQSDCPPSPDDEIFFQRQKVEDYLNRGHGTGTSAHVADYPPQHRTLTSSSSEDHFTSMSQSTSNPSIPSVISANSSIPDDCAPIVPFAGVIATTSNDSINQFDAPVDDHAGYDGDGDGFEDQALESDDESDEEDFIMMGKKKSARAPRSESISNAELARSDVRKDFLSDRRRSTRSGSNGTVKKIRPLEDLDLA
ncbi:kinase-like protein [Lophiostoma macrostomum CBS 122681]|uniref:non-specific serine/threonine protein kinase n=1 Tax=Lophiostoma macrostomum CBS 122681 TaxID=1314788 RepID=A0A6A6TR84_9PLEO|nr:kinase-like protein [Lophiostoma macrostomum CBS 122681]